MASKKIQKKNVLWTVILIEKNILRWLVDKKLDGHQKLRYDILDWKIAILLKLSAIDMCKEMINTYK